MDKSAHVCKYITLTVERSAFSVGTVFNSLETEKRKLEKVEATNGIKVKPSESISAVNLLHTYYS